MNISVSSGGGGVTDHTLLTNIGTNTHAQIDTKLGTIVTAHTGLTSIGTNTHAQIDTAIALSVTRDAKAWCNFDGTGTPTIRKGYNCSSITDGGVGFYTVNFTSALTDANYTAVANCTKAVDSFGNSGIVHHACIVQSSKTTTSCEVMSKNSTADGVDVTGFNLIVFD